MPGALDDGAIETVTDGRIDTREHFPVPSGRSSHPSARREEPRGTTAGRLLVVVALQSRSTLG